MSKTAIDIYIGKHLYRWKESPFYVECKADWDGESQPCTWALLEIERHNLYFVNKIIDYNKLIWAYNEASKMISAIPRIPTLKEQLQNAGKVIVGMYMGFKSAGPVGFFTGTASAVSQIIADEKMKRAAKIQSLLNPLLDEVQQAEALRQRQEQMAKLKIFAMWGGGALAVGGVVWWMLSD